MLLVKKLQSYPFIRNKRLLPFFQRSNKVVVNAVVAESLSHDGLGTLVSESLGSERTLAHLHGAGDSRAAGSTPCSGAVLFMQGPPGNNKTLS